ncbi:MAG: MMPL family transporter, partial [Gammaproteobacteria bacterium]|nr:MMPL family transporter [Gammaproteobacteria bacterium]
MSLDRYIDLVLGRRWWVLAFVTLFMLAMAVGAGQINVAYDYRLLLGKDNPQLADFNALEDTYTSSNTVLIGVAPRRGAVFTRETLAAVEELTDAAWRTPGATRVDSLTNFSHSSARDDELIVEPLVEDAASLSDAELARIKDVALNSIDLAGRLVSRNGRVAGLAISFAKADREGRMVTEATEYLNGALNEARRRHPNIDYYLTGNVVLNHSIAAVTAEDSETLIPIAFLVVLIGAALLLRSLFGTVSIVFVILFSIATVVGFAGWIGMLFTPVTSFLPSIVMVITVAHAVHVISTTLSHLRKGLDRKAAIAEALRSNAYPVFLTSLTTAIGFLCLNSSDSPPFRDLGNLVAFGVLCAFFYTMTLLPALLSLLPVRAPAARSERPPFFDRFGDFVVARRRTLLWSVGLVAVILVAGIPRLDLSDDWTKDFSERHQFRQDTDFVIANLTGLNMLEFSLDSGREGGITEPAYLRAVDAFAEWFRGQPEVTHVQAFPDIMKRLNRNMHADDPAFYRLPENAELSAQYLLLYELSLPFGRNMNDRIDVAKSATRMTVTVG